MASSYPVATWAKPPIGRLHERTGTLHSNRGASLSLDDGHWQAVRDCHGFLKTLIGERRRLYGITTGYGPLAETYVDPSASTQLQRGLVYHLSAGTGPLLNREQVRAIIAEQAITLAQGHSAVHPDTLARLLACLSEDWLPEVPAMGTVGASGDLTPLAHHLNNALITLAVHSERRLARLTDPAQNGDLAAFVRGNDNGLHSGFMGAQVTATALVAELRTLAQPASIQSIPTNANNQDVVTLGTIAARRAYDSLNRLSEALAIEAMALTQAYELKGGARAGFSGCSRALAEWVRERVAALGDDRSPADDIQRLARALGERPLMPGAFQ